MLRMNASQRKCGWMRECSLNNEKQHQFNELVQDSIEAAQRSLNAAIEKAKEALKEGEKL